MTQKTIKYMGPREAVNKIKREMKNIFLFKLVKYSGHTKRQNILLKTTRPKEICGSQARGRQRYKWEGNTRIWKNSSLSGCRVKAKDRIVNIPYSKPSLWRWLNRSLSGCRIKAKDRVAENHCNEPSLRRLHLLDHSVRQMPLLETILNSRTNQTRTRSYRISTSGRSI